MNTTKQKQQAKKDITKQQDTKGVTTRYNWALIKKQFMLSDVATIQEYRKVMPLKYFPGNKRTKRNNGSMAKRTKGRTKDKDVLLNMSTDEGISNITEQVKKEIVEKRRPDEKQLNKMMKTVLSIMEKGLAQLFDKISKGEQIDPRDVKHFWDMLKAERNEPTKINKLAVGEGDGTVAAIVVAKDIEDLLK